MSFEVTANEVGMNVHIVFRRAASDKTITEPSALSVVGPAHDTAAVWYPGLGGVAVEAVEQPE